MADDGVPLGKIAYAVKVSAKELNRRYAFCSAIKPEQIQYLESQQLVRIPIYRWDRQNERRRKHSVFRYESEYPLYAEAIVFLSVSEFALKPEVHLEYYIVERIRFIPQKEVVVFETDFPVGLRLRVRAWNASLHPSGEVVGKCVERVRWFVLWEEVARDIVLL